MWLVIEKGEHTETCKQILRMLFDHDQPIEKVKIAPLIKSMTGTEEQQPEVAAVTSEQALFD